MIKYHAQFLLDKEKDNPTAKLRYRIKWSGFIVAFNVGYRIEVDKWSKETQRCKINTTHGKKKVPANIINRKIQEYEQACEKVFLSFEKENKIPNDNEFRARKRRMKMSCHFLKFMIYLLRRKGRKMYGQRQLIKRWKLKSDIF